jgi:hypothetical protein
VSHFTPWDFNWGFGPPWDAIAPNGGQPSADKPIDNPCEREGSIIECQNQTLGEQLPIVGTPYHLRYTSGMAAGYAANSMLRIPLSGSSVPASLARIDLRFDVAGRHFEMSFAGVPNQTYDFIWDHKDAYGRIVQGWHAVTAQIGFVYAGSYQKTERFGYSGNGQLLDGSRNSLVALGWYATYRSALQCIAAWRLRYTTTVRYRAGAAARGAPPVVAAGFTTHLGNSWVIPAGYINQALMFLLITVASPLPGKVFWHHSPYERGSIPCIVALRFAATSWHACSCVSSCWPNRVWRRPRLPAGPIAPAERRWPRLTACAQVQPGHVFRPIHPRVRRQPAAHRTLARFTYRGS